MENPIVAVLSIIFTYCTRLVTRSQDGKRKNLNRTFKNRFANAAFMYLKTIGVFLYICSLAGFVHKKQREKEIEKKRN